MTSMFAIIDKRKRGEALTRREQRHLWEMEKVAAESIKREALLNYGWMFEDIRIVTYPNTRGDS